ncbi:branched-chain amino acid transport system permease protein [Rhizobium petrolearium]|uniref:Branched-chain amino acid ABC transporter permease n=2 Tax=Neorhizobium TaxID=1525371 RepID=A0ABV0MFU6_9HYPH|nr:branched-chain amino acid ABC transporter permease [Neorhizobium petrolearium]MBP1848417.1 branched-chain amino acid transport system permease protein [Neorhizobium petrolearium]MCC2614476.1 branched-chain amino acid ABC transporter permease [Neorhizobium petrolearium]WGI72239.1 branched-chain amino acid ABC transporter permease [Neorhizobium petrolearium]
MSNLSMAAAAPKVRTSTTPPVLVVVGIAVALVGFVLPWLGLPRNILSLLTSASMTAILATGVGFLVRQAGFSSFGHAAFYGGAAYLLVLMSVYTGLSGEAVVLLAPVIATLAAFALSFILLRTQGVAFSMLSLAIAQALFELMMRWRDLANGEDGLRMRLPREIFGLKLSFFQKADTMFLVSWSALIIIIVGLVLLSRSHFGTLTLAIKNNEERARFIGFRTLMPRAAIIALSGLIASIGGTLFALYNGYITPGLLHWSLSGEALIIAIIGGTRSVWGPALGAFLFVILRDFAGNYTTHWQSIVGLVLIAVVILLPSGASGAVSSLVNRIRGGRDV